MSDTGLAGRPWRPDAGAVMRAVCRLTGLRRWAVALTAGVLAGLAMPPVFALPGLVAGLCLLTLLIDARGPRPLRRAALAGFLFGYAYFLVGLYWIGVSLTVDAEAHAWLIPVFVLLFPAGLALFMAAGTTLARALWTPGPWRVLTLAAALGLSEWLRGHILTGFPWNLPGMAFAVSEVLMQPAALVGAYGLSLIVLLAGTAPAGLVTRGGRRARGGAWPLALAGGLLAAGAAFGAARLSAPAEATALTVRIVQPNVAQAEKYLPRLRWTHFEDLLKLTTEPGASEADVVVWPEAAPPFIIDRDPQVLALIGAHLPPGAMLLTGAVRVAGEGAEQTPFNSFHAIDTSGRVRDTYDKFHLVPFGEYLPLRDLLEPLGLTKIVQVPGSFGAGQGPRTLAPDGLPPFSPLICYEIIFPGAVTASDRRPEWLVNVTDDSWFGDTSGPRQHLAIARMRAIEEGVPVVRAANTGISALIDPYGRVLSSLPYGMRGVLDGALPAALPAPPYTVAGDLPFGAAVGAILLGSLWRRRRPGLG